jgi:acetoin utilization deacetylase AcuC-like enzyme
MGDAKYFVVWGHLLLHMTMEFKPDLVLILAGFDAGTGDVGGCHVTPQGFGQLTRKIYLLNLFPWSPPWKGATSKAYLASV